MKRIITSIVGLLALPIILVVFLTRSELIEVDGYKVETVIRGQGGPTVVFESGFTGGRIPWLITQYQLSKSTSTLVYQRAGLGNSATRPEARTAAQMAQELFLLLQQTELPPPYILVGHSAGGMYMKSFADQYPGLIGAMVFVDPASAEVYQRWQANLPNGWNSIEDMLIESGASQGSIEQLTALPESIEQLSDITLPLVPTTIITATMPSSAPLETEADMIFWQESHNRLAASIPNARHVIYDDKNHANILFDKRIVEEIQVVIQQVDLVTDSL